MSDKTNQDDNLIEGHDYDGIQELDNPLPAWWLWTFIFTVIFGVIYFIHYESGSGPTSSEELTAAMSRLESLKKNGPLFSETQLTAAFTDETKHRGAELFKTKCAVCHGPEGGGLIGPNLTDKSWLHGTGTRSDILKTISDGVVEKGMPPWKEQISENDLMDVASYIHSIKGTFVPHGKPPQGQEQP